MNDITFYQRFEADILAGRKTITIRDKSESHFKAGDILRVGRFEDDQLHDWSVKSVANYS